uniref:Uncharacterized protein n=1 Tax=viral metagenome TaxID=1070528 RepID=A0A6M3KYK9_9ZZZZ
MDVPDAVPETVASAGDKIYWFLYKNRAKFISGAQYALGLAQAIYERNPIKLIRVFIPAKAKELKEDVQMSGIFKSKKFWEFIASLLALILVQFLGLPEETAASLSLQITGLGMSLITGQALADGLSKGHTSSTPGSADHPV